MQSLRLQLRFNLSKLYIKLVLITRTSSQSRNFTLSPYFPGFNCLLASHQLASFTKHVHITEHICEDVNIMKHIQEVCPKKKHIRFKT